MAGVLDHLLPRQHHGNIPPFHRLHVSTHIWHATSRKPQSECSLNQSPFLLYVESHVPTLPYAPRGVLAFICNNVLCIPSPIAGVFG